MMNEPATETPERTARTDDRGIANLGTLADLPEPKPSDRYRISVTLD